MKKVVMLLGVGGLILNLVGSEGIAIDNKYWYYECIDNTCKICRGNSTYAVCKYDGKYTTGRVTGDVTIPSCLGSYQVVGIGSYAFENCIGVTKIDIPEGVYNISQYAFYGCLNLKSITIPSNVRCIDVNAFKNCYNLTNITFQGDMPTLADDAFAGTPRSMTITVGENSIGWDYYKKNGLTAPWEDRKVIKPGYPGSGDEPVSAIVALATTNVVIHYLTTNVPVNVVAPVSRDTAIVNVMTEIEGGNIAIPDTWAKNYPDFEKRFGSDFSAALTKYTGKYDGAGNPLFVWQDYVAGTDPTDVYDVFTATITMVDGKPQVQWDPVLVETEAAKRVYTKYGKVKLTDEEWEVIPEGEERNYNFFKVTVKMK